MRSLSTLLTIVLITIGIFNPIFAQLTPKNIITEKGKFIYQDGSIYFGDLVNGRPEGQGTVHYANGDQYTGGWKDNVPHGEGEFYWAAKKQRGRALWNKGKRIAALPTENTDNTKLSARKPAESVKIWAIVVGVSNYHSMPSLEFADDDWRSGCHHASRRCHHDQN